MDWYFIDSSKPEGKRRNGPWSLRQLLLFAEQGAFTPETLVWKEGFETWKPWREVETKLKIKTQAEIIQKVIDEKQIQVSKAEYASLWHRISAFVIDYIIVQFTFVLLGPLHAFFGIPSDITPQTTMAELMPAAIFALVLFVIYDAFFTKNFSGTPGKIALKLIVVRHNGEAMTWSCAFLRSFVGLSLTIGSLIAIFDPEKRTLQDFVADTRVLKM